MPGTVAPVFSSPIILGAGGPLTNTGNTTENTLATVVVPVLNVGDKIITDVLWEGPNNANNKTYRTKFGGTLISSTVMTTTPGLHEHRHLVNTGAASQRSGSVALHATGGLGVSAALTGLTITTSAPTTVTFTAQCADGADTITLQSYIVWLIRAK